MPIVVLAQWTSLPSFANVLEYCSYGDAYFCRCPHGAFVSESNGEINTITKSSGLSSARITASTANADGSYWALGYGNGSIDICRNGKLANIVCVPLLVENKYVRALTCEDNIVVGISGRCVFFVDVSRMEMYAQCVFDFDLENVALKDGFVYIVGNNKIMSININSPNLQDYAHWIEHVYGDIFATKQKYEGAIPASMPEDYFSNIISSNAKMLAIGKYATVVTKSKLSTIPCGNNEHFTAAFFNPYNSEHIFLGSNNGILYEYLGNNLKAQYNVSEGYSIIDMDCTEEGDLFVLSNNQQNPVKVFDHNGNWHVATSFASVDCGNAKKIIRCGNIFVVNVGKTGIFAVDTKNTPLDFADDASITVYPMSGNTAVGSEVTAVAIDNNNKMYVGTDKGLAYLYDVASIFDNKAQFVRPIVTETSESFGEYSQYLLSSKRITDIVVDAAGRKWLSTYGAGVFVVTESCSEQILRFNEENSILPSDTIYNMTLVPKTGEVYFATSCGLASYMSGIQQGNTDLASVVVYPNPVRPDYNDVIHISGLMDGSDVRITDANSRLVYKTVSEGGAIEWDGCNLLGHKCASGVYIIFVYQPDTGSKIVKKLLIIR
jgi:hypothetical protein